MIKIYNENCFDTMKREELQGKADVILTSPFYNTNRRIKNKEVKDPSNSNYNIFYDIHTDTMTDEEYNDFTVGLFNNFDKVLKTNGVILYNLSYNAENSDGWIKAVNAIICRTDFSLVDTIIWKKSNALPNNCSPNKLTRICEFIFVFCRTSERMTFKANKQVKSVRKTGQKMYENIHNIIEARNNDGCCPYNLAIYSTELCEKLFKIYVPDEEEDVLVYDPFSGSGTTAVACKELGYNFIGSETSENQVNWSLKRLGDV